MSLWTPSGEHPVGDDRPAPASAGPPGGAPAPPTGRDAGAHDQAAGHHGEAAEPGEAADLDALRRQLADAPADVVVANHCYGLFELAALYLSGSPPHLEDARLAIDAFGCVVDGLGERLGEAQASLSDALAQIRLAFVQISASRDQAPGQPPGNGSASG